MATARRELRAEIAAARLELEAPDPDEITARHDLDELRREIRQKQPSIPEVHIHTEAPRDSTPPEIKIAWKHRGLLLRALPWIAGLGLGTVGHAMLRAIGVLH